MEKRCLGKVLGICLLVALSLLGCDGGDDNDQGTDAEIQAFLGSYSGTLQDSQSGAGPLTFTLNRAQLGSNDVVGTWTTRQNSGTLSGVVSGTGLVATLTPTDLRTCPFRATGGLTGNQISGSYAALNCTQAVTGTFTVTRQ